MRLRRNIIASQPSAKQSGYITFTYVRAAKLRGRDIVSVPLYRPDKHGLTAAMRLGHISYHHYDPQTPQQTIRTIIGETINVAALRQQARPPHLFVLSHYQPIDYRHPDSLRNRGIATRLELDALLQLRARQPHALVADPVPANPTPEDEARAKQLAARGHEPGVVYPLDEYVRQLTRYLYLTPRLRKP